MPTSTPAADVSPAPTSTPPEPGFIPPGAKEPAQQPAPVAKKFELTEDRIPEKYRTAADPLAEFLKGHENLNSLVGKKDEEVRAALKTELEAELFKERPEAADKYELPKVADVDPKALAENDLVSWWRETAFKQGLGQKGFEEGIVKYLDGIRGNLPDPVAEKAALGENAGPRLEAVSLWVNTNLKGDDVDAARELASTAKGVKLLETLMKRGVSDTGEGGAPLQETGDDEATIRGLMATPAYYAPQHRDPKVVARVDAYYAKFRK